MIKHDKFGNVPSFPPFPLQNPPAPNTEHRPGRPGHSPGRPPAANRSPPGIPRRLAPTAAGIAART